MKYENFKRVKSLVEQIEKHQSKLDDLNGQTEVIISKYYGTSNRIYTIGTWNDCEHEYKKDAYLLVATIQADLRERIMNLKTMLETL